jgi:S-adenosylmethionine hydrolase
LTGAKLASGTIPFTEVGPLVDAASVVELETGKITKGKTFVKGSIDILDVRFGSLWTNIPRDTFLGVGFTHGERVEVIIKNGSVLAYDNRIYFGKSFADVRVSEQIIYVNSVYNMAVAINQGNFARAYNIGTGKHWEIEFRKVEQQL